MLDKPLIEVCVDSVESALAAEKGGADRIELCANLCIGGTTPSKALVEIVKERISIPVHVLIRPRAGDFYYSDYECQMIERDILIAKESLADGVVIGVLQKDGRLDKKRMRRFIELARPMKVTLHRAFDMTPDAFETLNDAISLGVDIILTSGQKNFAYEGTQLLSNLISQGNGQIDIMPGSGVNKDNIIDIINTTKATSIHFSAKKLIESKMEYRNPLISMNTTDLPEYTQFVTDETIVQHICALF